MTRSALLIFASVLVLGACNRTPGGGNATQAQPGTAIGIETAWMDKSVQPGDDFFAYADGNYVKTAQIPADRTNVGAFSIARDAVEKQNLDLIDSLVKANPDASTNEGRIVAFCPPTIPEQELGLLMAGSGADGSSGASPGSGPDGSGSGPETPVQEPTSHD